MNRGRLIKALAMTAVALGTGVGIVYAVTETDQIDLDGGNIILDTSNTGTLKITRDHANAGAGLTVNTDILNTPDWDSIRMNQGFDSIDFGGGGGLIWFDTGNWQDSDSDWINYVEGANSLDDTLQIRADNINITSNAGDVVIRLGSN